MLREEEEGGYVIDGLRPDDKLEYMQNIVYPQFQKYFKEGKLWITKFESVVKLMIDRVLSSSSFDAKVWYVKQFYRMKIVALRECAALMQGFIQSKDHHHFPIYRKMLHRRSNERRNFVGGYLTVCSTEGLRYELRDLRAVVTGKRGRKIDAFESEIDADHAAANEYSKTVMNISAKFLKHIRSGMFKVDSNDTSNYLSCKAFDGEDKLLSEVRLVETEIRKSLYSFEDLMKLRVDEYEDIGPTSLKISKAVLDDEDNEKMTMPVEESVNEIKRAFGIDPLEQEKNAKRFRNESLYEQPEDAHFFASPNRPKKQISTDIYLEGTLSDSVAGIPSYYLSVPVIVKYTELRSEGGNEKLIKRSAETTYHFMNESDVPRHVEDLLSVVYTRDFCAGTLRGIPKTLEINDKALHTNDALDFKMPTMTIKCLSKSPLFVKLLALIMQKIFPVEALQPIPRKVILEVENFLVQFPQSKTLYISDVGFNLWGHGRVLGVLLQSLREVINEPLVVETRHRLDGACLGALIVHCQHVTATRCQLDAKQFGAAERALQVASALDEIETLNLRSNCITSAGPGELIPNGFIDFVESVLSRAPHLRLLDVSECAAVDNLETGCEYILQCLLKGCNSRAANGIATPLSLRFEGLGQFSTVLKKLEHSFPQSCVLDVGGDMLKSLLMQLVSS